MQGHSTWNHNQGIWTLAPVIWSALFVKLQIFIVMVISLCFRFSLNHISNASFLIILTDLPESLKFWYKGVRQSSEAAACTPTCDREESTVSTHCLAVPLHRSSSSSLYSCPFSLNFLIWWGIWSCKSWNVLRILQILILKYQRQEKLWRFFSSLKSCSNYHPPYICLINVGFNLKVLLFSPLRQQRDIFEERTRY